jgi:uncharacterized protein with FMN-binding domain
MNHSKGNRAGRRLACGALSAAMLFAAVPGGLRASAAEAAPVFQSAKNYGGDKTDALHGVAYTKDGGFVAMGYSFGESTDPAWTHTGSGNNNDAVMLKFDQNHRLQWSKAYGDTGIDVFNAIDVLTDGRIVAVGRAPFTAEDKSMSGVCWYILVINPEDPEDYVEYRIGGTAGDQGYGVAATSDGGFVVGGWSASKTGFISSSTDHKTFTDPVQLWEAQNGTDERLPNRLASSSSDSIVVKLDKDGAVQFTALHNYGILEQATAHSSTGERLEDLTVDGEDNIYLVGYNTIGKNAQNAILAKLSGADGSLLWHRSAGRAEATVAPEDAAEYIKAVYDGVTVLTDGSVVVTGTSDCEASTEEAWDVLGAKDTLVVHYAADRRLIHAESFGSISDNDSRPEGVTATPDGGYIVFGSQSGVMREDSEIAKGYNWGNYGAQDAIMVKYNADDSVAWAENYGTSKGDWINDVTVREDGEIIAVGESNGKYGCPAWNFNGGTVDGIIMCTNLYPDAYTEPVNGAADGNVVWADGAYTGTGDGYGGKDSINLTTTIEGGKIVSVVCSSNKETAMYYNTAVGLYDTIVEKQSADVDGVSGATFSSEGIKEAASKTLSQAAAAHVDSLIAAIDSAENKAAATQAAADAYGELGAASAGYLKQLDTLTAAAKANGVALTSRSETAQGPKETLPQPGEGLAHNDTYYKLQNEYLKNIHAEAFAQNGLTGQGVKIAVIDSGITSGQMDLDYSRILEGYDYENDRVMDAASRVDNNGHGTAVTGILSATADNGMGVAGIFSQVQVVPLRVIPVNNPKKEADSIASSQRVARAIRDAVDKYQADVITTSLDAMDTTELSEAVAYTAEQGVIITGASGNSSSAENNGADPYIYPASYDQVVSVGAVDNANLVRENSQKNDQVFVTAPGANIALLELSRMARCKLSSGTSYASPMVAAMAVAAKQYDRSINTDTFKLLLQKTSADAGAEGYDTSYGYGVVDYAAFADALLNEYKVTLDQSKLTLTPGQTAELKAEVQNLWKAEATGVTWTTSNAKVAKVDENGKVTAVGAGTAVITATSKDDSGQTRTCTVVVKVTSLKKIKVAGLKDLTYTGKKLTQKLTVTLGKKTLKNKTDYTVTYKDNKKVGTATVTITGKGVYGGTVKKTFRILPKGTGVSKVTAAKKGFTIKWKKQAVQTTGYEVQYSTSAKFTKKTSKTVKVKKVKTTSVKVTKLKAKKKYYVRVRTYKTVQGKAVYSTWSKAKTVTTRK